MKSFVTRPMMRRSLVTAVIVGGILFTINHDLRVLVQPWNTILWRQLGLSMVIPFLVSLTSSVLTCRELLAGVSARTPVRSDALSSVQLERGDRD